MWEIDKFDRREIQAQREGNKQTRLQEIDKYSRREHKHNIGEINKHDRR